jgi:hypothetical protein
VTVTWVSERIVTLAAPVSKNAGPVATRSTWLDMPADGSQGTNLKSTRKGIATICNRNAFSPRKMKTLSFTIGTYAALSQLPHGTIVIATSAVFCHRDC